MSDRRELIGPGGVVAVAFSGQGEGRVAQPFFGQEESAVEPRAAEGLLLAHQLLEALILRADRVLEERHLAYLNAPNWETATVLTNAYEWTEQLPHLLEYPALEEIVEGLAQAMAKLEEGDLVTILWQTPEDSTDESKPVVEEVEKAAGPDCAGCKMPYSKVGRYGETPYCFACWIVASGTPLQDLQGGGV